MDQGQMGEFTPTELAQNDQLTPLLQTYLSSEEVNLALCIAKSNESFDNILEKVELKEPKKRHQLCGLKSELSSKLKASLKGNKNEEMKAIHYALEEKMKHHLKELEEIKDVNSILKMKKDSKIHTEVCQYVMKFADYQLNSINQAGGNLGDQITKIITIMTPQITQPTDLTEKLLNERNFDVIEKREDISGQKKKKLIQYISALDKFQDYIKYKGNEIKLLKKQLTFRLIKELIFIIPSWSLLQTIVTELVENPMKSISSYEQLSKENLQEFYEKLRKIQILKKYRVIKNIPESLNEKLEKDIKKIVLLIQESRKLSPDAKKSIEENLKKFNQKEIFKMERYRDLFLFIKKQCLDYEAAKKKGGKCTLEKRTNLTLQLRQFMEKIQIPYILHDEIEKCIFEKNRKEILTFSLSKKQKVELFQWLNEKFHEYYELQFYSQSFRSRVRSIVEKNIIDLDLELTFSTINDLIDKLMETGNIKFSIDNSELNSKQKKKVKTLLNECEQLREYSNLSMIDVEKQKRVIKRKLIYNILIPDNIGQLEPSIIFTVAQQYAKKPLIETIRASKLLTEEEKKKIKNKMNSDPQFKEHKNKYLKLQNTRQTKLYEEKLTKELGKDEIEGIWPYLKYYCEIKIEDDVPIIDQEYEDYDALLKYLDKDTLQALKQQQQSSLFKSFKKNYPSFLKSSEKQLSSSLEEHIQTKLEDADVAEKKISTTLKGLRECGYSISKFEEEKYLTGNVSKIFSNLRQISEINDFKNLKRAKEYNEPLLTKIKLDAQVEELLSDNQFQKYDKEDLEAVQNNIELKGVDYLEEDEFLSIKDKNALKKNIEELDQYKKYYEIISGQELQKPVVEKTTSSKKNQSVKNPPPKSKVKPGKVLSVEEFKKQIDKKGTPYNTLVSSFTLLQKASEMIEVYPQKGQILAQYKQNIAACSQKGRKTLIEEIIQVNDESMLVNFYEQNYSDKKQKFFENLCIEGNEEKRNAFQGELGLKGVKAKKLLTQIEFMKEYINKFAAFQKSIIMEEQLMKKLE